MSDAYTHAITRLHMLESEERKWDEERAAWQSDREKLVALVHANDAALRHWRAKASALGGELTKFRAKVKELESAKTAKASAASWRPQGCIIRPIAGMID